MDPPTTGHGSSASAFSPAHALALRAAHLQHCRPSQGPLIKHGCAGVHACRIHACKQVKPRIVGPATQCALHSCRSLASLSSLPPVAAPSAGAGRADVSIGPIAAAAGKLAAGATKNGFQIMRQCTRHPCIHSWMSANCRDLAEKIQSWLGLKTCTAMCTMACWDTCPAAAAAATQYCCSASRTTTTTRNTHSDTTECRRGSAGMQHTH